MHSCPDPEISGYRNTQGNGHNIHVKFPNPETAPKYQNLFRESLPGKYPLPSTQGITLVQQDPAITQCHGTENNVCYSGVFVIANTPL